MTNKYKMNRNNICLMKIMYKLIDYCELERVKNLQKKKKR